MPSIETPLARIDFWERRLEETRRPMTTETKTKHTPGPWRAKVGVSPLYRGLVAIIEQSQENFIGIVAEAGEVPQSDWEANARLIAVAPEMLGAASFAEEVLRLGNSALAHGYRADAIRKLRVVIAKATGEQP